MNQISLTSTKAGPLPHKLERHIELPSFEKTAAEIRETGKNLIALSKASIEKLKSLKDSEIQFETSLGFLDDLEHYESKVLSRIFFCKMYIQTLKSEKRRVKSASSFKNGE